jgi:phage terminase large subunit-like protein
MAQLHLPHLHTAQAQIKREARRFNVLCCGRRFGKDVLGHRVIIDPALRGKPVAWFAPTYRMMLDTFRDLTHILQPIAARVNASDHRIELQTGGVIDFWSLDSQDTARGRKYARAVLNEAAMVGGLETAWTMVIRPTLADYSGDAFFLSTPRGVNYFRQLFVMGQAGGEYNAWHFPTGANPYIKPTEVEAMRASMPDRAYRQEILAEFIEGGVLFRNVRELATLAPSEPIAGHNYIIGVDWARSADYTVFAIVDVDARELVALDRFTGIDYPTQLSRLEAAHRHWNGARIIAETNAMGKPMTEFASGRNLPIQEFTTTAESKRDIIDALIRAFEFREIKVLDDAVIINELESYEELARSVNGMPRYGAPEGLHDDCVMALAFAWRGIASGHWWIS